ncbi:unnamed protein product [Discosporangium mesarthrocarpum]
MATLDRRRLALAANIALPEHLPLLAPIVAFGWYVRWKWLQAGRKGMRPIIRVVGFTGILLISMGLLPFNTMVNMYETSFLSREECTKLVAATEDVIARSDFIPGSGRDLSDDVPLGSFPSEVSSMVIHAMNSRLLPFLALHYPGRPVVKDYHVVKYSPIGSVGLGPDQVDLISKGDLAISVELSPSEDFVGGGIWFRTLGKSLAITYGAALIFPARVWRAGDQVHSGARHVLVASVYLKAGPIPGFEGGEEWAVEGNGVWGGFHRFFKGVVDTKGLLARRIHFVAETNALFPLDSEGVGGRGEGK